MNHRWPLVEGEEETPQPRSKLLDVADFSWALKRAVELDTAGDHVAALGMSEVAALLFDRHDIAAVELAATQEDTVNWESLAVYFDAIPIDGETADRLRRWHAMRPLEQRSDAEEDDLEDAAVLRDDLLAVVRACRAATSPNFGGSRGTCS